MLINNGTPLTPQDKRSAQYTDGAAYLQSLVDGDGTQNCDPCDARGRIQCEDCDGRGRVNCSTCDGEGQNPCYECNY